MTEGKDSQSIKYRLIGALVIIVSFTLAWLLLLDHDVKRQSQWSDNVPSPIEIERFEVEEPKTSKVETVTEVKSQAVIKPQTSAKAKGGVEAKMVKKPKPAIETVEKVEPKTPAKQYTQLNSKGLPDAWVLQVASFKEKANAKKLQQSLLKHDFPAYIKAFNLPSGRIYRVIIGPKMDKSRAQKMGRDVENSVGMKTLLVAYKPGFEE